MFKRLFQREKSREMVQIGIAENEQYCCMVVQKEGQILDSQWHLTPYKLQNLLLQVVHFSQNFTIIRPLPYQYIWRKYVFLPLDIVEQDIHKQVIYILKQQVPLPIEQIAFDYIWEEQVSAHRIKLVIYAIKKEYIDSLLLDKFSIHLDCELHGYLRAFHYLLPVSQENIFESSYHLDYLSFQFKDDALIIDPKESLYKYIINQINFSGDILDTHLYLKALGASLWNGEA